MQEKTNKIIMKYLKLFTTILFLVISSIHFAQNNVAHIDSQALISEMPRISNLVF